MSVANNGYIYPSDKSWGMTLRQHYAGLAMTKMIEKFAIGPAENMAWIAKQSFAMADAMLNENAGEGYDSMNRTAQERNNAPNAVRD